MNISKTFSFLLIIMFVFSCENEQIKPDAEVIETIVNPIEVVIDSSDYYIEQLTKTIITNRNVEERLTEYGENNKETKVVIYTNYGNMRISLYKSTPLHRANFVMLSKRKFYDNTLFYRVIDNFMIQGGNSNNDELDMKMNEIGAYWIPNEISSYRIHKKGAIAMAVSTEEQRFEKKSSAINFYIIEGRKLNSSYFDNEKIEKKYTKNQIESYISIGGAPHLDGNYTVFGEITSGLSTLSRISRVKTDKYDWPETKVVIDSIRVFNY